MGIDSRAESGPARLLTDIAEPLRDREAFIGRQLAELMGVRAGDEVAVVGQGVDGSLANDLFTVRTPVTTSVDLVNRQGILIELSEAQTLFAMPDEAHEIVIHARRPELSAALARRLAAAETFADAEVLDWQTLAPEMVTLVRITDLAGTLVLVLVFIAAAAGVANTMVMATFERTREFGMLLALGTHPVRLMRLVVAESIALGLIGAVIGTSIGIALVVVTHRTGIDYSWLAGGGPSELSFAGLALVAPVLSDAQRGGCGPRDRRRLRHLAPGRDMAGAPREPAAARAGVEGHVMGTAWTYAFRSLRRNARRTVLSVVGHRHRLRAGALHGEPEQRPRRTVCAHGRLRRRRARPHRAGRMARASGPAVASGESAG